MGLGRAPVLDTATGHRFTAHGDGRYVLTMPELGLELDVDRLRRERQQLVGELVVRCDIPGVHTFDGVLATSDFNLSSATVRERHAKYLGARASVEGLGFHAPLEELCQRVLAAERTGDPAVRLRDVAKPDPDDAFTLDGLRLEKRHPVIVFGDGSAGKSLIALYCGGRLHRQGVRVLYADWEFSAEDHRARLERLFGAEQMPSLYYAHCDRPLVYEVDRLRRIVRDHDLKYVVFDSIAFACDGPPESAETAAAYFRAVRQLGVGSLHIAHTTKGDNSDKKPFGSAFWHNGARGTWFVKQATELLDAGEIHVGLFHRKSNTGPRLPAVGYGIAFVDDRIVIRRMDVAEVTDFALELPLWSRIRRELHSGPQTVATLARVLDAKADTVDKAARRKMPALFTRVNGDDGVSRLALVERRVS